MKFDITDYFLLFGSISIVVGVAQIYPPLAWIVAGMLLIAFACLIANERKKVKDAASAKLDN